MAFCTPDWSQLNIDSLGSSITPLPGWGDYRWDIATPDDSARFYFNQGINNPMIFWAQALAFDQTSMILHMWSRLKRLRWLKKQNPYLPIQLLRKRRL